MAKVQILWVTRHLGSAGNVIKPHKHDYYHMLYVLQGELDMEVGGRSLLLKDGGCVLVPKGMEHAYIVMGENGTEYLEIKFALPDKRLDERFGQLGPCDSDSPVVGTMIQQIAEEYARLGPLADEAATSYLLALLYLMNQKQRYQQQREFRYIDASAYSDLSQQIVHYLEEHFSESLSLDRLARDLKHGKSYLCGTFKKDTGTTILDCLNMIRIRRAAEMITYSEISIAQVSELCGFASPHNFNRVFLKYVGVTPGQCRRAFPADTLEYTSLGDPNHLIYSVLARKQISLENYLAEATKLQPEQGKGT